MMAQHFRPRTSDSDTPLPPVLDWFGTGWVVVAHLSVMMLIMPDRLAAQGGQACYRHVFLGDKPNEERPGWHRNEPDEGLGDGDAPRDIQGARLGTSDTSFLLRAERSGSGTGRVYTIVYTASDKTGNTAQAIAVVRVPHD